MREEERWQRSSAVVEGSHAERHRLAFGEDRDIQLPADQHQDEPADADANGCGAQLAFIEAWFAIRRQEMLQQSSAVARQISEDRELSRR